MALSSELISQFVKVTNDVEDVKTSNTVYGTVVEYEGEKYVRIDGSERLTRAAKVTDAEVNERVIVTIENHTATITGNISSPSARTDRVEELGGEVHQVGILLAGKVSTEDLIANYAKITDLTAQTARIDSLVAEDVLINGRLDAAHAVIVKLDTTYATIENLTATNAKITELEAKDVEITNLFADYATVKSLDAVTAKISNLETEDANIRKLFANYATINKLESEYATIAKLTANYATIASLDAVDAKVGNLDADVADINTLIFGSATGNTIQAKFANAVIAQLGDAQIKSAMIENVSAAKITSGDIITDNVNVKSQDGLLLISNQTIQISDKTRVRVQIGKDASNDYSINIWDANGKLMFSEGGLTEDAVKEQIIRNDMVKDDANISASKLDIDTLFEVINEDGSNTIKSTKVYLDEEGQTLDVSFRSMTTKIDGISVGGRNLVAGTSLDTVYSGVVAADSTLGYKDVWSAKTIDNADGTEYVVSFDAKADEEIDIRCFFYSPNTTLTSESSTGDRRGDTEPVVTDGVSYVHLTTEWKRYWVKWTQTPANDKKSVIIGRNSSQTNRVYIRAVKLEVGNKATDWTPAPEDVDAKTTELSTKYHNLNIDVGNLSSTIAEQSQLIDSKADGSTVTTLSTKYSTLEQTVNGLNTTVASHTSQIANKADGSTVTALSNQYTALSVDLSGFKTTVSETYTTKTEFNNLEIGGRNLLLNTGRNGTIKLNAADDPIYSPSVTPTNVNGLLTLECSTSTLEIYYRFMKPLTTATQMYGLEPGGTYTFSGKVKVSTTSGTLVNVVARSQDYVGGWGGGAATVIAKNDSDEWVNFKSTFTIRENATCCYISVQAYYEGSWTGVIQLKDLKFEKGNKTTDWTPAPEDVNADITTSAETYTQQTAELLGSYATKVDLTGYYTKSQTESAIEQKANSITSTVASTYSTKADLAALEVGGRNLIAGTSKDTVYTKVFKTDGYTEGVTGKTIDIPADDEYVLSFDAKSTVNGDRIMCHFYSPNTTLNVEVSTNPGVITQKTDGAATLPVTTSWKRYWVKYTQNGASTTTTKSWIVGRLMAGNGTGTVSIRAIKLEEGHVPTDWTPAPEDVDTEFGSVRSEIKQLADSITLSVTGSLGSTASIKLTANGQTTEKKIDIDMSDVRTAFANDTTAIDISAGTITFNSETLVIKSTNFTLDKTGYIEAKSGLIGGMTLNARGLNGGDGVWHYGMIDPFAICPDGMDQDTICLFSGATDEEGANAKFYVMHSGKLYAEDATISGSVTTSDGIRKAELSSGGFKLYYYQQLRVDIDGDGLGIYYGERSDGSPILCGTITSQLIEDAYQTTSLILRIPKDGDMRFAIESAAGGVVTHYTLRDTADIEFDHTDNDTYAHTFVNESLFMGVTKFASTAYFNGMAYFHNQTAIGWYTSSGAGPYQLISFNSSNQLDIGSDDYITHIYGSRVFLMLDNTKMLEFVDADSNDANCDAYFRPRTASKFTLGTSVWPWYRCYAKLAELVTSDRRMKENIEGLSDIHSKLFDKLQPVQYNLIDGDGKTNYGLIAQDVIAAMEELGIEENDLDLVDHSFDVNDYGEITDTYAISYTNLISMLVHEVQKLKREIKTLKGE